MNIIINNKSFKFSWNKLLWILIVLIYIVYLGSDLEYNTAFVDEAIYANVGEEFLRESYWERALSWMGGSYAYPIFSAFVNRISGLWGLRLSALTMILISGICVWLMSYRISKSIFASHFAFFIFLFSSPSLSVAQLATYDAPSLMMSIISLTILLYSADKKGWQSYLLLILSALFISAGILIKYVAVLSMPFIGLLIFLHKRWFLKGILWSFVICGIVGVYGLWNYQDLIAYSNAGTSIELTSRLNILKELSSQIPFFMIAIIPTIIVLYKYTQVSKVLIFALLLAGFSPIFYHLFSSNIRSLPKHLAVAIAYWSPLIAMASVKLYSFHKSLQNNSYLHNSIQFVSSLIVVLLFTGLWSSLSEHWKFQRSWPSASKTIEFLDSNLVSGDKVFAEGSSVFKYHLYRGFADPFAWPSTWYMQYQGKEGFEAMYSAIDDQEFEYIVFNNYFTIDTVKKLTPVVQENYDLVFTEEYLLAGAVEVNTTVWKRRNNSKWTFADLFIPSIEVPNLTYVN